MPLPVKSVDCSSQRLWMTVIRTWRTRFTFVAVRSNAARNGRIELHSWTCAEKRQAEGLAVHRKDDLADVLS